MRMTIYRTDRIYALLTKVNMIKSEFSPLTIFSENIFKAYIYREINKFEINLHIAKWFISNAWNVSNRRRPWSQGMHDLWIGIILAKDNIQQNDAKNREAEESHYHTRFIQFQL